MSGEKLPLYLRGGVDTQQFNYYPRDNRNYNS